MEDGERRGSKVTEAALAQTQAGSRGDTPTCLNPRLVLVMHRLSIVREDTARVADLLARCPCPAGLVGVSEATA